MIELETIVAKHPCQVCKCECIDGNVLCEVCSISSPEERAIRKFLTKQPPMNKICACRGPRDGEPACPCSMAWFVSIDDVWYRITEHRGPNGVHHKAYKWDQPS